MENRPWINTEEELDAIPNLSFHFRPELYLEKFNFPRDMLLDFFCSERLPICYEDYYYNDIYMDLIRELQPHIDADEFLKLWLELDEIREVEMFSQFICELHKRNYELYKIPCFQYDVIEDYIDNYRTSNGESLYEDYEYVLRTNRYSKKYGLYSEEEWVKDEEWIRNRAAEILKLIPYRYSEILPL